MSTDIKAPSVDAGITNPQGLGIFRMVTTVITLIIGGGVFSLCGDMAANGANTGAVLTAWALSFCGVFCLMMCFYGLSRLKPELTGGIYSYASAGFGDFVGFNSAWGYWISAILCTVSFSALLFSALSYFFPVFGSGNNIPSIIGASCLIWFYTFIVSRGIKEATGINAVITISKIVPIITAIVAIIVLQKFDMAVFMDNFWGEPNGMPFFDQVLGAITVTAWVFVGIEGAVALSGRAKRAKDVGRATVISFTCVFCIYVMVSILGMGIMPRAELAQLANPSLAGVLEYAVGAWGGTLVSIGVILSLTGAMLGYTVLSSESSYEAARQGVFVKAFAKTNKKGAPIVTLITSAVIVQAFLISMLFSEQTYQFFYLLSLGMILVPYMLSSAYFAKLAFKEKGSFLGKLSGPLFKWYLVGIVGVLYSLFLVYASGLTGVMLMSILYAPGIAVYIKGKHERGQAYLTSTPDKIIAAVILIAAVASIVLLATGVIDPFA
ncbi:MAG: basic amino acid/polyamine antiporter [Raoultibacter sp.]